LTGNLGYKKLSLSPTIFLTNHFDHYD
jgi:hypothetical protein